MTQFWVIMYITSEFSFDEEAQTLLTQFWVTTNITSEFNFDEENRQFICLVLGNNSHN